MIKFNEGDLVRIDFGNGEHDNIDGIFVHDQMRDLNGREFVVHRRYDDSAEGFERYKLTNSAGEEIRWTFMRQWLVAVETEASIDTPREMVTTYDGSERQLDYCVMLTEPSEHAGEYAWRTETTTARVQGNELVLLDDEVSELIVEISGDTYLASEYSGGDNYVHCGGGRYEGQNIWTDDAVYADDTGEYYHDSDVGRHVYWHEGPEVYSTEEPTESGCHDYHSGPRNEYTTAGTLFTIGFEVEKEDEGVLNTYELHNVDKTGWAREKDSSLDDDTGFELVSPVYDLLSDRLDTDIQGSDLLKDHINASCSMDCGGHINFGKVGTSGSELFKQHAAFMPLFLALYRKRADSRWSRAYAKSDKYLAREDRYVAFNIKHDYIEFRIISRVHNVQTLLWRRDLFRIMSQLPNATASEVQSLMLDKRSALHKHLLKQYDQEGLLRLACWYSQFADAMYDSLQFSKTGQGVLMEFFITTLKRASKRISIGIEDIKQWADVGYDLIRNLRDGEEYTSRVVKVSDKTLKFLKPKG
jgi:hypothetical protein